MYTRRLGDELDDGTQIVGGRGGFEAYLPGRFSLPRRTLQDPPEGCEFGQQIVD